MKSLFKLLISVAFAAALLLIPTYAGTQGVNYYVYEAAELYEIMDQKGNIETSYSSDEKGDYIRVKSKGVSASAYSETFVRFNFSDTDDFSPDFSIKKYPYAVFGYKSNIDCVGDLMPINFGLKLNKTGKYERVWGLESGFANDESYSKCVYDVNGTKSYDGGSFDKGDYAANSGVKYVRIPPWGKSADFSANKDEYIDIYYVAFFTSYEYASTFRDENIYTITFRDHTGKLLSEKEYHGGDTVDIPDAPVREGYKFIGWELVEDIVYTTDFMVIDNATLTAKYRKENNSKFYVFRAMDIDIKASKMTRASEPMIEDGSSYIRFNTPSNTTIYNNDVNITLKPIYGIDAHDFPIIVLGYRSDISNSASMAMSPYLRYNGVYSRFFGCYHNVTANEKAQKAVFDMTKLTGGEAGVTFKSVDPGSDIDSLRISPWGTNFGVTVYPGEYFDIQYVGFFRNVADANAFVYDEELYAYESIIKHNKLMDADDDYKFRPDDLLTNAEAVAAVSRIMEADERSKYKYHPSFNDIPADHKYATQIGHLQSLGFIPADGDFKPDETIKAGDFAELINLAREKTGIVVGQEISASSPQNGITRADAAKMLCLATGRGNIAYMLTDVAFGGFSDVSPDDTYHSYIIDVAYDHDVAAEDDDTEIWLSCNDHNFYLEPVPEGLTDELDRKFQSRVAEILATESEWTVAEGGKVFYVSNDGNDTNNGLSEQTPIKTLERVEEMQNDNIINAGDVVLLRRGDEWYHKRPLGNGTWDLVFATKIGVSYSAYGTGDKPRVLGSIPGVVAGKDMWKAVSGYAGLYEFQTELPHEITDVGNIVFNDGEFDMSGRMINGTAYGQRVIPSWDKNSNKPLSAGHNENGDTKFTVSNGKDKWIMDIAETTFENQLDLVNIPKVAANTGAAEYADLMYYHNWDEDKLYLYSKNGDPDIIFDRIDICIRGNAVTARSHNLIDNWCIKFTGSHGIGAQSCVDLTVRNCELGWIGGSYQKFDDDTRFGNGIEIYGSADGYYVYNNYIYQCFDCGPTVQWGGTLTYGVPMIAQNVEIRDNALWDADLEVWMTTSQKNYGKFYAGIKNCDLKNNYVTGSGYGFGGYNHQKHAYCCFYGANITEAEFLDVHIKNNYFWNIRMYLLKCAATSVREGMGFNWHDNTIIMDYGGPFAQLASNTKTADGGFSYYERLDNELIKKLLGDGCLGFNSFYYTLPDGDSDPKEEFELTPKKLLNAMGDINGDGELTPLDTTLLARYIAGWDVISDIWGNSSDVNENARIDTLDLIYISRAIAGWHGYEL